MGNNNVLQGLSCREVCCSEYVTDIGENWVLSQQRKDHKQLNHSLEFLFEFALGIVNICHLLISIALLIFGLYTYFLREEIHSEDLSTQSELVQQLGLVPIYLIVIGSVVIVVSIIGTAGVMRHNLPLLYMYSIFLVIYAIAQIICIIIALTMKDRISDSIYNFFSKDSIVSYRDDPDLENIMNYFQIKFKCCGGSDDYGYLDWTANQYFRCYSDNKSYERCNVPFSCCIGATVKYGETVENPFCGYAAQTMDLENAGKIINTNGCAKAILTKLQDYSGLVVLVLCCLIVVPICLVVLIVYLIRDVIDEILGYKQWLVARKSANADRRTKAEKVKAETDAQQSLW